MRFYLLKILFCVRYFSLKPNDLPQSGALQIRFYDIEISTNLLDLFPCHSYMYKKHFIPFWLAKKQQIIKES